MDARQQAMQEQDKKKSKLDNKTRTHTPREKAKTHARAHTHSKKKSRSHRRTYNERASSQEQTRRSHNTRQQQRKETVVSARLARAEKAREDSDRETRVLPGGRGACIFLNRRFAGVGSGLHRSQGAVFFGPETSWDTWEGRGCTRPHYSEERSWILCAFPHFFCCVSC